MKFTDLDLNHKQHILVNGRVTMSLLRVLATVVPAQHVDDLVNEIWKESHKFVGNLTKHEIEQMIADIEQQIDDFHHGQGKPIVAATREDRN